MFDDNTTTQPAAAPAVPAVPAPGITAPDTVATMPTPATDAPAADPLSAVDPTSFNTTPVPDAAPVDTNPITPAAPAVDEPAIAAPSLETTPPAADPVPATTPNEGTDELVDIKQQALQSLSPLLGQLDQSPEEKFRTTMMMIQASDNQALIKDAYEAAQAITDEKAKAQALLDIVNEINYFTQHGQSTS